MAESRALEASVRPSRHPRLRAFAGIVIIVCLGSVILGGGLTACGGGGGGGDSSTPGPPTPFTGRISYDKVPFGGAGLNFNAVIDAPVRGAVIEAIAPSSTNILATTNTDANGNYTLTLPQNTQFFLRAKAQLLRNGAGGFNFRVVNNTNANALYVLDSGNFTNDGSQRNLRATSGWGGVSYTGQRNAAPFSLLDVAYEVATLVQAADAAATFPALNINWSTQNQSSDNFTPATGEIQTTHFRPANVSGNPTAEVYVLGQANVDTDEFDQHVIAHELGHYIQDSFSRDDSVGGPHSGQDRLDMRVAFSEGWGNAFSGMVKNDPRYRDSSGPGQAQDFDINVESEPAGVPAGWYAEQSVGLVLYDLFDAAADGVDNVSLGFAPIFQVMRSFTTVEPLTSIFPFVAALKANQPASAAGINAIVGGQGMTAVTMDELGSTEGNNGGEAANLPIYRPASVNGVAQQVCTSTTFGDDVNKLGSRRFLRFQLTAPQTVTVRAAAVGGAPGDPDFYIFRNGLQFIAEDDSSGSGVEQKTTPTLPAGFYVLEVFDFRGVDADPSTTPTCVDVTISP